MMNYRVNLPLKTCQLCSLKTKHVHILTLWIFEVKGSKISLIVSFSFYQIHRLQKAPSNTLPGLYYGNPTHSQSKVWKWSKLLLSELIIFSIPSPIHGGGLPKAYCSNSYFVNWSISISEGSFTPVQSAHIPVSCYSLLTNEQVVIHED